MQAPESKDQLLAHFKAQISFGMNPLVFYATIRYYRAPVGRQTRQPHLPLTMAETEPSGEGRVASRVGAEACFRLSTTNHREIVHYVQCFCRNVQACSIVKSSQGQARSKCRAACSSEKGPESERGGAKLAWAYHTARRISPLTSPWPGSPKMAGLFDETNEACSTAHSRLQY